MISKYIAKEILKAIYGKLKDGSAWREIYYCLKTIALNVCQCRFNLVVLMRLSIFCFQDLTPMLFIVYSVFKI